MESPRTEIPVADQLPPIVPPSPTDTADSGAAPTEGSKSADETTLATIRLEVVNPAGRPVSSVQVGDEFELRLYLELTMYQPFSAFADVQFDADFVTPVDDAGSDVGLRWARVEANRLDEVGRIMFDWSSNPSSLIFSKMFTATKEGLAIFESDAADLYWKQITALGLNTVVPHLQVTFGSAKLEIKVR